MKKEAENLKESKEEHVGEFEGGRDGGKRGRRESGRAITLCKTELAEDQ